MKWTLICEKNEKFTIFIQDQISFLSKHNELHAHQPTLPLFLLYLESLQVLALQQVLVLGHQQEILSYSADT